MSNKYRHGDDQKCNSLLTPITIANSSFRQYVMYVRFCGECPNYVHLNEDRDACGILYDEETHSFPESATIHSDKIPPDKCPLPLVNLCTGSSTFTSASIVRRKQTGA